MYVFILFELVFKDAVCQILEKEHLKMFVLVCLTLKAKWLMKMIGVTCITFSNFISLNLKLKETPTI